MPNGLIRRLDIVAEYSGIIHFVCVLFGWKQTINMSLLPNVATYIHISKKFKELT